MNNTQIKLYNKLTEIINQYSNRVLLKNQQKILSDNIKEILKFKLIELFKQQNSDFVDDFNIYINVINDNKIDVVIKPKYINKIEGTFEIL